MTLEETLKQIKPLNEEKMKQPEDDGIASPSLSIPLEKWKI